MTAPTSQCPACYGTGRNKRGGPCSRCRATGRLSGAARTGASLETLGKSMVALAFFGLCAAFMVALLVAIVMAVV